MELTKEQRLDWYVYMYLCFLDNPNVLWNDLWHTKEVGSLTGFEIDSYVGRHQLPELEKYLTTNSLTVRFSINECEKSNN